MKISLQRSRYYAITKSSTETQIKSKLHQCSLLVSKIRGGSIVSHDDVVTRNDNIDSTRNEDVEEPTPRLDDYVARAPHVLFTNEEIFRKLLNQNEVVKTSCNRFFSNVVHYNPPVGIVAIIVVIRLLFTGRIFSVYDKKSSPFQKQKKGSQGTDQQYSVEDRLFFEQDLGRRSLHTKDSQVYQGRSLVLDSNDQAYEQYGGIQHVRNRLCLAVLMNEYEVELQTQKRSYSTQQTYLPSHNISSSERKQDTLQPYSDIVKILSKLAQNSNHLKVSRIDDLKESMKHVACFEYKLSKMRTNVDSGSVRFKTNAILGHFFSVSRQGRELSESSYEVQRLFQVIEISIITAQMRVLDKLLRLCRDILLKTSYRLVKTTEYWDRRVEKLNDRSIMTVFSNVLIKFATTSRKSVGPNSQVELARIRLSYAQVAYQAELKRLGEVVSVLMEQPNDLPYTALTSALKLSENDPEHPRRAQSRGTDLNDCTFSRNFYRTTNQQNGVKRKAEYSNENHDVDRNAQMSRYVYRPFKIAMTYILSFPNLFKYGIQWRSEGQGYFTFRKFDISDLYIGKHAAMEVLLDSSLNVDSLREWKMEATAWMYNVRQILCSVVKESAKGSTGKQPVSDYSEDNFTQLENRWCGNVDRLRSEEIYRKDWNQMLQYITQLPTWRRIGEGKEIRFRDAFNDVDWFRRLDFFGVPSSLLAVSASSWIHDRSIEPYWVSIHKDLIEAARKLKDIVHSRFWIPLVAIYNDIMNKSPSMMSGFALEVEEVSLDRMLRDLGLGDGTPPTRQEALKRATELYEQDFEKGLLSILMRGRLVRLLLVQMQQLKVGMLSALDTIDVLLEGNRIHFQLLAAIPAVVVVTYGTRFFLRSLYNIRAKDIRPVTLVHSEMKQYLDNVEKVILLAENESNSSYNATNDNKTTRNSILDGTGANLKYLQLKRHELGDIALNLHRYLFLMDFCCPPFRARICDHIHKGCQEFLGNNGSLKRLDTERNLQLLARIQAKHHDLLKSM